jgi:hypothetical protein|tara:strand:+ start:5420 stop:5623 length:204 start_codon:yes stop_codon:yes gene_type:complete
MTGYELKDKVMVRHFTPKGVAEDEGVVVARTIEENPRYDVALADGKMVINATEHAMRPKSASTGDQR